MRKIIFLLIVFLNIYTANTYAISAKSMVVIDSASGKVLFEKNAYEKLPMASTTKIMTGLLACESGMFSAEVTTSPVASGTEGSSLWLKIGEKQTLENLTYGLMLKSGNDAAVAIAEYLGGNVDAFALLMNKRARETGAVNTNFKNPHGLDSNEHYTTAYDLALIAREAMKNEKFREIVSTKTYSIPMQGEKWDRALKNHNKLLWRYDGCNGVKTGFTKKCGRCLVSSAKKDNEEYICVTLNAPDDWNDHKLMLDKAFSDYDTKEVLKKTERVTKYEYDPKNKRNVWLRAEKDFFVSACEDDAITTKINFKKVKIPTKKNTVCAIAEILCNGEKIGEVNLVSEEKMSELSLFEKVVISIKKLFR